MDMVCVVLLKYSGIGKTLFVIGVTDSKIDIFFNEVIMLDSVLLLDYAWQ